jgi:hypothetical protein
MHAEPFFQISAFGVPVFEIGNWRKELMVSILMKYERSPLSPTIQVRECQRW